MAAYFQLISRTTGQPATFNEIDEELCELLEVPCDANKYICGWYDSIGFRAAMGSTWDEIESECNWCDEIKTIVQHLKANYDINNWSGK